MNPPRLIALAAVALCCCCCSLLQASTDQAAPGGSSDAEQRLEELQAQVAQLQRQLAAVVGAEAVSPGGTDASSQFVPSTGNTQRTLARQASLWPHHFALQAVVAADSRASASHVLTDRPGRAGSPLFFVLGDAAGALYFFTPGGLLLYEYDTGFNSAITALSSDLQRHNETQLLLGLQDGSLVLLLVGHEHARLRDGSGIHSIRPTMLSTHEDRAQQQQQQDGSSSSSSGGEAAAMRHVMFGKSSNRRLLLAADDAGALLLLLAASGRVLQQQVLDAGTPLAMHLHASFQVVVQTSSAAAVVLLRRGRSRVLRSCEGLGQPDQPWTAADGQPGEPGTLVAAAFDPARSFRVFGVTAGGDLVALTVPSGTAAHQCKVMQRIRLGLPPGPVHLVMSKGQLVLLHAGGVAAFGLSAHRPALAGSHLVSSTWSQLWPLYALGAQYQQQGALDDDASSSSSSSSMDVLHTHARGSALLAATATPDLLLLPFGERGVAVFGMGAFAPGGGSGSSRKGSGRGGSGSDRASHSGSGGGGGNQQPTWLKLLQPLVVVSMLVVGAWQFIRASSRSNAARLRGGRYGSGAGAGGGLGVLGGGDDDDLTARLAAMAGGYGSLAGADFSSLDRDFGAYAGPRGSSSLSSSSSTRRDREAPLASLNARRRARAAMFSNRQQQPPATLGATLAAGGRAGAAASLLLAVPSVAVAAAAASCVAAACSSSSRRLAAAADRLLCLPSRRWLHCAAQQQQRLWPMQTLRSWRRRSRPPAGPCGSRMTSSSSSSMAKRSGAAPRGATGRRVPAAGQCAVSP